MFKYYRITDKDIVNKIIGENPTIKFTPAFEMNDPFELKFNLKIDPNSAISKIKYFENFPDKSESDYKDWQNNITDKSVQYTEQKIGKKLADRYNLTCFTETNDNNLMWSHYTNNHSGICVEYSDNLLNTINQIKGFFASGKVYYSENPPIVDVFENAEDQIKKMAFHKQSEWKYEKEFRILFRSNEQNRFISFESNLIKTVFIGCNCPQDISKHIIEICKKSNIKVYQATTMGDNYKVKFEEQAKSKLI